MRSSLSIALLLLVLGWIDPVRGEVAYVTDMLQLGLHAASDTSDRPLMNLPSGTRLEVLERSALYARVRTPSGDEGWVKAAFIVSEPPARYRLDTLEREVESLREQLAGALETERRAVAEAERLRAAEAEAAESARTLRDELGRLEKEHAELIERFGADGFLLPLEWVLAALVVAFVAGGGFGWWVIDTISRRRHAGYRVY
ncbi:MAG: TIGR04211 family SH3 domain-containing protein [Gammaproteobacteria bacterium]|nr:TIGR04211 family SH3 domain-containing protein [Gammaproteobacteria bacterium]